MTRIRTLIGRSLVLALLLLTLGGSIANADSTPRGAPGHATTLSFPDDPGFIP